MFDSVTIETFYTTPIMRPELVLKKTFWQIVAGLFVVNISALWITLRETLLIWAGGQYKKWFCGWKRWFRYTRGQILFSWAWKWFSVIFKNVITSKREFRWCCFWSCGELVTTVSLWCTAGVLCVWLSCFSYSSTWIPLTSCFCHYTTFESILGFTY